MSRKLFVLFAAFALITIFFISRAPSVEAQSSGCSAFPGLVGGFLQEFAQKDTGVQAFNAGETIQIAATIDGTSTPFPNITWYVTGNTGGTTVQSGAALSYTIPTTQDYRIVIESTFGNDANIAASCAGGGGGAGPQWSGLFDGRLNPDPAENYSIFCGPGYVDVYTTFQGQGNLLARISQSDLSVLNYGQNRQVQTAGSPLIVTRLSQTAYRFAGNNGNRSPEYGEKDADLAPCGLTLNTPPPTATPDTRPVIQVQVFAEGQEPTGAPPVATVRPTATPPPPPSPTPDLDPDRDGVVGQDDLCPMFSYIASKYKLYGCRDTDGDGYVNPYNFDGTTYVLDDSNPRTAEFIDECPQVFGQGNNGNGCPDVATAPVTQTNLTVNLTGQPPSIQNTLLNTAFTSVWQSVTLTGQSCPCILFDGTSLTDTNLGDSWAVALCDGLDSQQ